MANPVPRSFRAVEIALVAIKQNRFETWAELVKSGADPRLTPEQLDLVESELAIVNQIQVTAKKLVTLTYCPVCSRIAFFGVGTMPSKCTLTFGCTGKPVKAGAVKRAAAADGDDADVPEVLEQ
jgi:hypothetical protein